MMKSWKKRILGIIVCTSLVLGTVTLPTFAETSVQIPVGQNTWDDDDSSSYDGSSESFDDGTQSDPETGLPIDTDPIDNDSSGDDSLPEDTGDGDVTPDDTTPPDDVIPEDEGGITVFGDPGAGTLEDPEAGDPGEPATELEAAKRMTISTNITPETALSGSPAILSFSMSYNSAGGTIHPDPAKFRAVVTSPSDVDVAIIGNDMFRLEGTDNTSIPGFTVTTLVFNQLPAGGGGSTFDAVGFTTSVGTIPNGSTYNVNIRWTYDGEELLPDQPLTVTNETREFGWKDLTGATSPTTVTANITYVPDFTVQYSLSNTNQDKSVGYALTKSIEVSDLITVDQRIIVTSDMLDSLEWTYNGTTLTGGSYEILSYHDEGAGHIKEFRASNTIANSTLEGGSPAEIGNVNGTVKLTVKGARVNKDKANSGSGGASVISITNALRSTSLISNIYPCVSVASSNSYLNKVDDQGIAYQELSASSGFYLNVNYYWVDYEPVPTNDPGQTGRIEKHVVSVTPAGGSPSTNPEDLLDAYPGDNITYQLRNFGNYLEKDSLKKFVVTDEFNLDEMYPITISPGYHANAGFTMYVRVYIKEGTQEEEVYRKSYTASSNFSTTILDLRTVKGTQNTGTIGKQYYNKALDVTKISKIEFDYGVLSGATIQPGFRPYADMGPKVTTVVRNRNLPNPGPGDPEPQATLTNTALVSYEHDGTTYDYDSLSEEDKEIDFNFKDENEIVYYQNYVVETGNKSFMKIRGKNGVNSAIEKDDLLEFTIKFRNPTTKYAMNPFFDDTYTGMVPYLEDDASLGYDLEGAGYDKPFISLVSVKNEMGVDVTEARALEFDNVYVGPIPYNSASVASGAYVYQAPEKEPLIGENTMRVRFRSTKGQGGLDENDPVPEYYIHPGDEFTVTYVMKVTDPAAIYNKFKAYAYPIFTGDPELIHFTGGDGDGGSIVPNPYKPTVKLTQTVKRADGGNDPTNTLYPVEDQELLDVKLTLQNSSVKNVPPMTLYGFTTRLYNYYNSVLKYLPATGDTIEVKVYKNGTDTEPTDTYQLKVEAPGTGFQSTSYKEQFALVFRDGQNNPAPITLTNSGRVELSFQIEAEGWAAETQNASYLYQYLYSYAIFKDVYGTYNGSAGTSASNGNANRWISDIYSSKAPYASYLGDRSPIRLSRPKNPYVQAWASSYTTSYYLPLNNLAANARPERTGNNAYVVQIFNKGQVDLPITKIYVKLPQNERFKKLVSSGWQFTPAYSIYDAEALPGLYGNRQIVVLTPKSPLILKPGYSAAHRTNTSSSYYIGIETFVHNEPDNNTAAQMIADHVGESTFTDSDIQVAFYSEGVTNVLSDPSVSNRKVSEITEAEKDLWGGAQMDADLSKGALRKANDTFPGQYRAYYPVPGVALTPLRKFTTGSGDEYRESTIPFSPTEQMGWRVDAGLQNDSDKLKTLQNAVAVVKLPSSMTYTGILGSGYTDTEHEGADGYTYVVVPLGTLTAGTDKTFTITATLGPKYGGQTAEVFLFGSDEFYTARSGSWGVIEAAGTFPGDIKAVLGMTPSTNLVKNTRNINVSGMFAFNSEKGVSVSGGGKEIARGIEAFSREDQILTYTLTLSNEGSNVAYNDLTIIDRLPVPGDKFVLVDATERGSTTKATIRGVPTVALATVDANGNISGSWQTVSPSKYTVEYVSTEDAGPAYPFSNADFRIYGEDSDPEANWVSAAAFPSNKVAAAFRIKMDDALAARTAIRVTYDADAPEDDMPKQGAVAVNSFAAGFQAQISTVVHKVKPEPDLVMVTFPDIKPMIIEGTIFTEDDDKVDGIYNPGTDQLFTDFTKGSIKLNLYKADDPQGNTLSLYRTIDLDPAVGTYRFDELYDDATYYVEITGLPEGYTIYEEIKDDVQGNKFTVDGMTDGMRYEEGKTHRRNADILKILKGTLTLEKKLPGTLLGPDSGKVGGKDQKFVFRIDYTPAGESAVTQTFYEVLTGNESKVVIDLPMGTYTVTEMAGWATGFQQSGGTAYLDDINVIDRKTPDITAICINERSDKSFFHAIGEAINKFNEKAPKVG